MSVFQFKHFSINQKDAAMKVGTDAMLLGAFVDTENKSQALDIGTGTGVLSLMLAQKNETLQITAIDIDELSAQEALINFQNSNWTNRLNVHHSDFLLFETENQYDLIVSNPPYFSTTNQNKDERKAQARHVSSLAIGPFIEKVSALLSTNGHFWLIIPYNDVDLWQIQLKVNNLHIAKKIDVLGKEGNQAIRSILKIDFLSCITQTEIFCVRNKENSYSEEYIELTKDFHGLAL